MWQSIIIVALAFAIGFLDKRTFTRLLYLLAILALIYGQLVIITDYSDVGEKTVISFELQKAHDTIQKLTSKNENNTNKGN